MPSNNIAFEFPASVEEADEAVSGKLLHVSR